MATRTHSIRLAVGRAIKANPPPARSEGIVALARKLATEIDDTTDPAEIARLSPRLLDTLVELGMGRAAAGRVSTGGTPDGPAAALDELRSRRATRQHNTTPVDPSPH